MFICDKDTKWHKELNQHTKTESNFMLNELFY